MTRYVLAVTLIYALALASFQPLDLLFGAVLSATLLFASRRFVFHTAPERRPGLLGRVGVFVMTVGVYGAIRMPDTYTKLHAMSKAVFLGVVSLCASSAATGDPAIIYRAVLIAAFLLVTTPISAFVIARAAYLRSEKMEAPDAVDESGRGLARSTE